MLRSKLGVPARVGHAEVTMVAPGRPEPVVDRARPEDAGRVARLISAMLDPFERQFTIWSSPRIDRYVRDLIESPTEEAPAFSVIRRGRSVEGTVYLRTVDGEMFIDGLYVEPSARKDQLSNFLLYRALKDYARARATPTVAFDGAKSKAAIRAWQRRMFGAREVKRTAWWRVPRDSEGRPEGDVVGLDEADEVHRRWGFSRFEVVTPQGSYTIGRLPRPYFRLADSKGTADRSLMRTLAHLDPSRDLCVTDEGEWIPANGRLIDVLIRSHVEFQKLLGRLKDQIPERRLAEETASR